MNNKQIFPVLSNAFFVVPAFTAFGWGVFLYGVIYALIPFTSGTFHACEQGFGCLFSFQTHTQLDYIFATLIIPMTGLYLVHWEHIWTPLRDILLLAFALVISLVVTQVTEEDNMFIWQGLIIAASVAIPITYWIGYYVYARYIRIPFVPSAALGRQGEQEPRYFPKYEWGALLAGVSLTVAGVTVFMTQGMYAYEYVPDLHGMWHVLAAFGQGYLMQCKAPERLIYYIHGRKMKYINSDVLAAIEKNIENVDKQKSLYVEINYR